MEAFVSPIHQSLQVQCMKTGLRGRQFFGHSFFWLVKQVPFLSRTNPLSGIAAPFQADKILVGRPAGR